MAVFFKPKDKRIRALVAKVEVNRICLRFFARNAMLSSSEKYLVLMVCQASLKKVLPLTVRARNRCNLTSRAGSVFRDFRVSRIMLKELASRGRLTGVRKSS